MMAKFSFQKKIQIALDFCLSNFDVLNQIDVDQLNFVENPEDLGTVFNRIDAELNGLF